MIDFEVVRVFCGADGRFGNRLGVVRDGAAAASREERQAVAGELGFSETVFVDDAARGVIDIYTPTTRLPFAGHPCVGTAWLVGVSSLVTAAGTVSVRRDGDVTWVAARAEWAPPRTLREYASSGEVDALEVPPPGEWIYAWARTDESAEASFQGIRARGFPGRSDGIDEDEATGAAALLLTAELGRPLLVTQGRGSQIFTRPLADGLIEVGGRVSR
ncbi:PhzF family phenazine biosynthesis protein [Actinomadura logoneensis]|uniref:PhzF family phenazine biosynthesis protein n=1 Tax=Actinomadura logoneensis TaxID=2293572 RepID=A0A372JIK9_9ACTN|nr:PhzF family phenazine biosynthesis protein [Actinomadura logoneensis]RFU39852.1 PhzF family phenazine biosynthesis protein [Actinomadura logoneensis]